MKHFNHLDFTWYIFETTILTVQWKVLRIIVSIHRKKDWAIRELHIQGANRFSVLFAMFAALILRRISRSRMQIILFWDQFFFFRQISFLLWADHLIYFIQITNSSPSDTPWPLQIHHFSPWFRPQFWKILSRNRQIFSD